MTDKKLHAVDTEPTIDKFDPAALRLSQSFQAHAGVKKLIRTVPVRKPDKQWFVRTRPEPEYRLETAVIELRDERETYIVAPDLCPELPDEISPQLLVTAINRQSVLFLWPIRLPGLDGKTNEWNRSALDAVQVAHERWIRVQSNMSLGAYECLAAMGELPDPEWPDMTFSEILKQAFQDRYIEELRGQG